MHLVTLLLALQGWSYHTELELLEIRSRSLVLRDEARQKDLTVYISFPTKAGKYPLIVFSHGAGGAGDQVSEITDFWASYGYVVVNPTHADSAKLNGLDGSQPLRFAKHVDDALNDEQQWRNRAGDVKFVMDSIKLLEEKAPGLRGKIDGSRIGVGGHSFGAFTTQLIGGVELDWKGKKLSFGDPRPKALLMMSPQGKDQQGLNEHSWDSFKRPFMSMTGSLDRGWQRQAPEWRRDSYKYSLAKEKYHLFIEGALHSSFTGTAASGERLIDRRGGDQKEIFEIVKSASLAFWDAYLKQGRVAAAYLKGTKLASAPGVKLEHP